MFVTCVCTKSLCTCNAVKCSIKKIYCMIHLERLYSPREYLSVVHIFLTHHLDKKDKHVFCIAIVLYLGQRLYLFLMVWQVSVKIWLIETPQTYSFSFTELFKAPEGNDIYATSCLLLHHRWKFFSFTFYMTFVSRHLILHRTSIMTLVCINNAELVMYFCSDRRNHGWSEENNGTSHTKNATKQNIQHSCEVSITYKYIIFWCCIPVVPVKMDTLVTLVKLKITATFSKRCLLV